MKIVMTCLAVVTAVAMSAAVVSVFLVMLAITAQYLKFPSGFLVVLIDSVTPSLQALNYSFTPNIFGLSYSVFIALECFKMALLNRNRWESL